MNTFSVVNVLFFINLFYLCSSSGARFGKVLQKNNPAPMIQWKNSGTVRISSHTEHYNSCGWGGGGGGGGF